MHWNVCFIIVRMKQFNTLFLDCSWLHSIHLFKVEIVEYLTFLITALCMRVCIFPLYFACIVACFCVLHLKPWRMNGKFIGTWAQSKNKTKSSATSTSKTIHQYKQMPHQSEDGTLVFDYRMESVHVAKQICTRKASEQSNRQAAD